MAILQRPVRLGLVVLSLLAPSLASAQVVKCVDAKGRVEYGKTCSPGSTEAGRIQRPETPTPATPTRAVAPASGSASAKEVRPDELDNAEDNVCRASNGAARARAALAEKGTLPVEQLAGPVADSQRREFLQQQLNEGLVSGQRGIVTSQEKDLVRYQAEYRRMTGSEFNTALCVGTERRIKRREVWETQRREAELRKHADQVVSNEAEGIRAICKGKQAMNGPSKELLHQWTADQVKFIQERGQAEYTLLAAAYERSYKKRFDPANCP